MWIEQKRLRVQDLSWDRGPACPVTQGKMGRPGRGQGIHLADRLGHGMHDAGLAELHGECRCPGEAVTGAAGPNQGILRTVACEKWKGRRGGPEECLGGSCQQEDGMMPLELAGGGLLKMGSRSVAGRG